MKNPKKIFSVFVLFLSIMYLAVNTLYAQTLNADRAFQDYQFQLSSYNQAFSDYTDAKNFYKKSSTLQLREEARKKTLVMLKSRDQLMVVYLTAIRARLNESEGFKDEEKSAIFAKIDPEIAWYQSHISTYQDGDDLNALFTKSDESRDRFLNDTKNITYETIFDISLSDEIGYRVKHDAIYKDLKAYLDNLVSQNVLRIDPFNRWLNDTDLVLSQLTKNEDSAKTKIQGIYAKNALNQVTIFNSSTQILANSLTYLYQLNNYLMEILNTISNLTQ